MKNRESQENVIGCEPQVVNWGNWTSAVHSGSSQHSPIFRGKEVLFLWVWGGHLSPESYDLLQGRRERSESFRCLQSRKFLLLKIFNMPRSRILGVAYSESCQLRKEKQISTCLRAVPAWICVCIRRLFLSCSLSYPPGKSLSSFILQLLSNFFAHLNQNSPQSLWTCHPLPLFPSSLSWTHSSQASPTALLVKSSAYVTDDLQVTKSSGSFSILFFF